MLKNFIKLSVKRSLTDSELHEFLDIVDSNLNNNQLVKYKNHKVAYKKNSNVNHYFIPLKNTPRINEVENIVLQLSDLFDDDFDIDASVDDDIEEKE